MVDITSILNLQARARRNALMAARALHARRAEAAAADRALDATSTPADAGDRPVER